MKNKGVLNNNKFKFLIITLISILLTFTAVYVIFSINLKTAEAVSETNYDEYVDDDKLLNSTYTIRDYVELPLHATKGRVVGGKDSFSFSLAENDPIALIVPEELFFKVNSTLKVGTEYGFYISTKQIDSHFESTVLVFDIEYDDDLVKTIDKVTVEVKPLFQYKYAGLKGSSSITFDVVHYGLNYIREDKETLSYHTQQNRVIALPVSPLECKHLDNVTEVPYGMVDEYYLKDISFGASLFNEQELNKGDAGYNPYSDLGTYFTSFDYTYNGRLRKDGEFPGHDLGWSIADTVMYGVGWLDAIPGVGTVTSIIGQIYDIFSLAHGWVETGLEMGTLSYYNDITSGELTVTPFYQNRDDQLLHYRDNNNQPTLTKTAVIDVNSSNTDGEVWYGVGGGVTFYLGVNHSALNGQQAWRTHLIRELKLKVVNASNEQVVASDSRIDSHSFREKVYKELKLDIAATVSLLPNGENSFYFTPLHTSDYTFSLNLNNNAKIKLNGVTLSETNPSVRLNADTSNTIEIYGNTNRAVGNIVVSPNSMKKIGNNYSPLQNIQINANGDYLFKIPDLEGVKALNTGNNVVVIQSIYNNSGLYHYAFFNLVFPVSSLTHPFLEDNYYVVLKNNSLVNAAINFTVGEPKTLTLNTALPLPLDTNNFTYVKFMADSSNSTYKITALNMNNLSIIVLNSALSNAGGTFYLGNFYQVGVGAGQTCYIGIKSGSSVNAITINKTNLAYQWRITGGGINATTSASTYELKRGATYTLELLLDGVVLNNVVFGPKNQETAFGLYSVDYPQDNQITLNSNCQLGGNGIIVKAGTYDVNGDLQPLDAEITLKPKIEDITSLITGMINTEEMAFAYSAPKYVIGIDYIISPDTKVFSAKDSFNYNNATTLNIHTGSISFLSNYNSLGYTSEKTISIKIVRVYYVDVFQNKNSVAVSISSSYSMPGLFGGGSGTSASPYLISHKRHFNNIAKTASGSYYYRQTTNFDFYYSSHSLHTVAFYGTYNGNGYYLKNISYTINTTPQSNGIGGIFGWNYGTIKNIKMQNLNISAYEPNHSSEGLWMYVGGIVGANYGGLLDSADVYSSTITVKRIYAEVGGIAGYNHHLGSYYKTITYYNSDLKASYTRNFNIYDCDIWDSTKITGSGYTGGIAGINNGNMYSCYAGSGTTVSLYQIGENNRPLGGITGENYRGYVVYCNNYASIKYDSPASDSKSVNPYIGKIAGTNYGSYNIAESYCGGSINTGTLSSSVGGSWFFNVGAHNQLQYVGSACNQGIGKNNP